jgi:sRNA-binding carbon storage regulator CsrA
MTFSFDDELRRGKVKISVEEEEAELHRQELLRQIEEKKRRSIKAVQRK